MGDGAGASMQRLRLDEIDGSLNILCLGAHGDDLEIGCGGTILQLLTQYESVVRWVVFAGVGTRGQEAAASSRQLLQEAADYHIELHHFRDGFFPSESPSIKEAFEALKAQFEPDLILTHTDSDRHQDHREISALTWQTFRNHLILEYEIPKYDGDLGSPNVFSQLDEAVARRKVEHVMSAFPSQQSKHWFDEETFYGLLRLRGVAAGVRYAEAFYGRKLLW